MINEKQKDVLVIFEEVLYRNLKDCLTYQMIFEIANSVSNHWQKKRNIKSLPDKSILKLAEITSEVIKQQLKGEVFFKFNHKKVTQICNILFISNELEKICSDQPIIIQQD